MSGNKLITPEEMAKAVIDSAEKVLGPNWAQIIAAEWNRLLAQDEDELSNQPEKG